MMKQLFVATAVAALAACGSDSDGMSEELRKDIDLAASSSGLELATSYGGQQIVSAAERIPPSPRRLAASERARRPRPAPEAPPEVIEEPTEEMSEELEPQAMETSPVATEEAPPVAPRPVPVQVSYPGGYGGGRMGGGIGVGTTIGVISVVLRGGGVDGDRCEEHERMRRNGGRSSRPPIAISNRLPVIRGTFPRY